MRRRSITYTQPSFIATSNRANILFDRDGWRRNHFRIARVGIRSSLPAPGRRWARRNTWPNRRSRCWLPSARRPTSGLWASSSTRCHAGDTFRGREPSAVLYQVVHETPDATRSCPTPVRRAGWARSDQSSGQRRPAALPPRAGQMASEARRLARETRPVTLPPARPAAHTPTPAPGPTHANRRLALLGVNGSLILVAFLLWQYGPNLVSGINGVYGSLPARSHRRPGCDHRPSPAPKHQHHRSPRSHSGHGADAPAGIPTRHAFPSTPTRLLTPTPILSPTTPTRSRTPCHPPL